MKAGWVGSEVEECMCLRSCVLPWVVACSVVCYFVDDALPSSLGRFLRLLVVEPAGFCHARVLVVC